MSEIDPIAGLDPETRAIVEVASALAELEPAAVARVLAHFQARLGRKDSSASRPHGVEPDRGGGGSAAARDDHAVPEDLPTFFFAANASTVTDKALVVSYHHQVVGGEDDFDSYTINKELKNLGHGSTNITRDFDSLIARRLVMQTRKSGKAKQARKRYRLTHEGLKAVEAMQGPVETA